MNKEPETILIYDDEPERKGKFKDELEKSLNEANQSKNFNVDSLDEPEFQNEIKSLEQRRLEFSSKGRKRP